MHVHAAAVVADDRLGHESDGLAVLVRYVADDVLHRHQFVGLLHQRIELHADLALAGIRHFVVMHFHALAERFQHFAHISAQIAQRVDRADREVAALYARAMTAIAFVVLEARTPRGFLRFDFVEHAAHVVLPAHGVEDEKFRLRTEESGVGDARGFQERLAALGDRARVAAVGLHGAGFQHVAMQNQLRVAAERIEVGGGRIRQQHHVRFVDALPARDRRTVEHLAVLEGRLVDGVRGEGHVVMLAEHVGKTQIDELDVMFLD